MFKIYNIRSIENHMIKQGGVMSKLWVVVADQSRARIFTVTDPHGELLDIGELDVVEAVGEK